MSKRHKDILAEAHERMDESYGYEFENRRDANITSQFIDGNQWDPIQKQRRIENNQAIITVNKLRKFVLNEVGAIQANFPGVNIVPKGGPSTVEGASLLKRLIRHIEDISKADIAYTNGLEQALSGGYGSWRILTEYEKDTFYKNIIIRPIQNRFSVVWDQNSQLHTYSYYRYDPQKRIREIISKGEHGVCYVTDGRL